MQNMKEGDPVDVLLVLNEIQATVSEQQRDENPASEADSARPGFRAGTERDRWCLRRSRCRCRCRWGPGAPVAGFHVPSRAPGAFITRERRHENRSSVCLSEGRFSLCANYSRGGRSAVLLAEEAQM